VVGWIKRGPTGIIGTNKPDSVETVTMLLEDAAACKLLNPAQPSRQAVETLLRERQPRYITFADWQILDALEVQRGSEQGRPRVKFARVADMLTAIAERKTATIEHPVVGD
jgi:ferredoxin--NADP+ reductase